MHHLILGGTGTVGGAVVRGLLQKSERVRVLTRSVERARALPHGAVAVVGDLTEPDTYAQAFAGCDTMFLLIGNTITELYEGLAALNEARRAGVRRIVYLSAHNVERGPHIPHFAAKLAIEEAIRESGIAYTILRPNNFYQNDDWFKEAIVGYGVYPQPIGDVGVSRVDVGDVAAAAVAALTTRGLEGRTFNLVGPEALTGDDCARAYSQALGQPIRYAGNDLAAFAVQGRQRFPAWLLWEAVVMFELFQAEGCLATREQLRETEEILGRAPRPYGDFVREVAAGL